MSSERSGFMHVSLRCVNVGLPRLADKSLMLDVPEAKNVPWTFSAMCCIIDHPAGRILWDTGVSPDSSVEWAPEWLQMVDLEQVSTEVCLEARLKQLGLGPDDFRYVVMSHLHADHAGGLRLFENTDVEIVAHAREYAHVTAMAAAAENFYARIDFAFLANSVGRLSLVDDEEVELCDGVELTALPGHSPGTIGLLVELPNTGSVLLASDSLYLHECYGPPAIRPAMAWDLPEWERSVAKARRIATEREAMIFPGHDATGIRQFRDRVEGAPIEFWPDHTYE